MRDVSSKAKTLRTAKAMATVKVQPSTIEAIKSGTVPKADPLGVAKVGGIQAAKNTSFFIPYCHQVPLDFVGVDITLGNNSITIQTEVKAIWKTGVEMEALVAASASALTLYDMLKPIDESMEIVSIKLLEKKGGKSSIKETGEGLTAGVLVMSDSVSRGLAQDRSGKFLEEQLRGLRLKVIGVRVLPDDRARIENEIKTMADNERVDLIVTTGGTGVGPRDVTPEATLAVIDRRLEGVEEMLRSFGQDRLPTAMLSRGVVGIRGKTLIINLPGSKGGVEDGINALFPAILHTFRMMRGEGHGRKGDKELGR
ncbi:MAG: bifunctional molybdenum cofactor biosynthesis protein MoaC/MoaB [Ignavibacteriae bacterium]|nr:bifunctional molybdenum cofactor biosynthesis protein MoaC/MoaB [Ignavibacteriota bacterium]